MDIKLNIVWNRNQPTFDEISQAFFASKPIFFDVGEGNPFDPRIGVKIAFVPFSLKMIPAESALEMKGLVAEPGGPHTSTVIYKLIARIGTIHIHD